MFSLLHASFNVSLGLSQHVNVIGMTLPASSLSYYLIKMLLPARILPRWNLRVSM